MYKNSISTLQLSNPLEVWGYIKCAFEEEKLYWSCIISKVFDELYFESNLLLLLEITSEKAPLLPSYCYIMTMLVFISALNNNPDEEYANSGNPMESMSDGAYSNAENHSAGIKVNNNIFYMCSCMRPIPQMQSIP